MKTTLVIEGMHCRHCGEAIGRALSSIPGVKKAEVSFERKEALVIHDSGTDPQELIHAVEKEGYHATLP